MRNLQLRRKKVVSGDTGVNHCGMDQEKQDLRGEERDGGGREKGCLSREGGMGGAGAAAAGGRLGELVGALAGGFCFHGKRGSEFMDREANAGQV